MKTISDARPTRSQSDLAEMLELLLDKGVVINADIAVTVGETELLGVQLRAAIASFETAAQYGLQFPEGTDMERVEEVAGVEELAESEAVTVEESYEEMERKKPKRRPTKNLGGEEEAQEVMAENERD